MNSTQLDCELSTLSIELSKFKLTKATFMGLLTVCIVNGMLSLIATLANILVIVMITTYSDLRTNSNILLLFLAITDLMVSLVVQPSFIAFLAGKLEMHFNCKAMVTYLFTEIFCVGLSLLTLCIVHLERYFSIFHPFWYERRITRCNIVAVTIIVWGAWTVFNVTCRALKVKNDEFFAPMGTVVIGCALVLNVTIYFRVYKVIRLHKKRIDAQRRQIDSLELRKSDHNSTTQANENKGHRQMKENRMTRTVGYILGFLILCYSPLMLISLIEWLTTRDNIFDHFIYPIAETVAFMNSALNPFIYCWRCHDIRRKVKELFLCFRR